MICGVKFHSRICFLQGVSEIEKMVAQSTLLKNQRRELMEQQNRLEERLRDLIKGKLADKKLNNWFCFYLFRV